MGPGVRGQRFRSPRDGPRWQFLGLIEQNGRHRGDRSDYHTKWDLHPSPIRGAFRELLQNQAMAAAVIVFCALALGTNGVFTPSPFTSPSKYIASDA